MRILLLIGISLFVMGAFARAEEEPKMFPFVVPTLDLSKNITDLSAMNEKPAGKDGFVTVKDGHFADGSGKRIRFFGTNLTFGACFPDHATAEKLARRLAKLGFNCIRFHHMDSHYAPRGIWDGKHKDKQHIDAEQLDKLDYLIHQLKLNGIYTNINLHVSRKFSEADGFPDAKLLPKYDKGVDNFEPRMIALQKKYAQELLTHENPYTKTLYAEEPAIAIVELNNENSLLHSVLTGRLEPLPSYYAKQLDKMWNDYLRRYYKSTDEVKLAWKEVDEPLGNEILVNPDFSNATEGWSVQAVPPGEATMEVVNEGPRPGAKALHARMTKPGPVSWSFQIHQVGIDLENGAPYTASFCIRSDKERQIRLSCRLDHAPWTNVGLDMPITVAKDWERFTFVSRPTGAAKGGNRIGFTFTNEPSEFWVADMSLRRGGYIGLPKGESLEKGTIQRPAKHGSKAAWIDYLRFLMETEQKYVQGMYDYLKNELKLRANVIDTQATYGGVAGIYRESKLDFVDCHAYWEHPRFPGRPWDPKNWFIPNTSMTRKPSTSTFTRLALCRVMDKPYTVSEYNHPAPNDYQAECVPMLSSFAAFQDWDGIFFFCYRNSSEDWERDYIRSYFAFDSNPAKIMMLPAGAMLFRRGDVAPAREQIALVLPTQEIVNQLARYGNNVGGSWEEAGTPPPTCLSNRLAVKFRSGSGKVKTQQPLLRDIVGVVGLASLVLSPVLGEEEAKESTLFRSDTGDLMWNVKDEGAASYTIDAPCAKVVVGFVAGREVRLRDVSFNVRERTWEGLPDRGKFASITLVSADGAAIRKSKRLLLSAIGRVENTDMEWNTERTSVDAKWGQGPTIVEGIPAVIKVRTSLTGAKVYSLDPRGNRKQEVSAEIQNGLLVAEIGPNYETLWYEIELE